MYSAYISAIVLFAGNFAPEGWAFCDGRLLNISGNEALFSLIGTTYGGDGIHTFALPDFRGRVPVGTGNNAHPLGQKGGSEGVTITVNNLPVAFATGIADIPNSGATQQAAKIGTATAATAHNNMQPYLGLNYIICLEGIYPSRD